MHHTHQAQAEPHPQPFISYFAATTPDSGAKVARLRGVLFLQGSTAYDVRAVRARLDAWVEGGGGVRDEGEGEDGAVDGDGGEDRDEDRDGGGDGDEGEDEDGDGDGDGNEDKDTVMDKDKGTVTAKDRDTAKDTAKDRDKDKDTAKGREGRARLLALERAILESKLTGPALRFRFDVPPAYTPQHTHALSLTHTNQHTHTPTTPTPTRTPPPRPRPHAHPPTLPTPTPTPPPQLANHRAALTTLVHDLRDAASAEAYCACGGRAVVRGERGWGVGEAWAAWAACVGVVGGGVGGGGGGVNGGGVNGGNGGGGSGNGDEAARRTELLRVLLEVYTADGEASLARRLLDAQGGGMDVVDILPQIPPSWPLSTLSGFLARSSRRTLHARHEGMLVKGVCAGENLEVMDKTWLVLRDQGAIVEEAADDSDEDEGEDGGEKVSVVDEKAAAVLADRLARKVGSGGAPRVVDVEGGGEGIL
ncbi:hypothetical protein BV22DRAFT_1199560 [Leucogyrophana mollusca]|uniref:Uncharacterized protein n=1 Tax=Leucogyrophana mollusca TaxID=85980 RepID=A0ACB8B0E7_9AGAM|nr:hypothetical protein BV22DRAFT_1199560 [Leucogyrophana mollusca]